MRGGRASRCSARRSRRRSPAAVAAGLITALVVVAVASVPVVAAGGVSTSSSPAAGSPSAGSAGVGPDRLALTVDRARVSLGPAPVAALRVTASPASLEVGIPCGMDAMCGGDPCLCGAAVDRWGACACNGLRAVEPTVAVASSDEGVVRVVSLGGTHWLLPAGTGRATVVVTGSLAHHRTASARVPVTVDAWAFATLRLTLAALVAAIVAGVFGLRRVWRSSRARRLPDATND